MEANCKTTAQDLIESSLNFGARKLVSLEDFFSIEDDVIELQNLTSNNTRIKGQKSSSGSRTVDPASVIPPTAKEESRSLDCKEQDIDPGGSTKYYTKIKEKARKRETNNAEESYEVIPPTCTASFKSQIEDDCYGDHYAESPGSDGDVSEKSSSSEEDDSDEGLFKRSKQKRKPGKTVVAEISNILKEGRPRLRR